MSVETMLCTADWKWFTTQLDQTGNLRFLLKELEKADDGIPQSDLDYYSENKLIDEDTLAILSQFAEGASPAKSKWLGTSCDLVISWSEAERLTESLHSRQSSDPSRSVGLSALLSDLGIIRNEEKSAFAPLTSIAIPDWAGNVLLGAMNPDLRREMLIRITTALKALESSPRSDMEDTLKQVYDIFVAARDLFAATARKKWGVVVIAR